MIDYTTTLRGTRTRVHSLQVSGRGKNRGEQLDGLPKPAIAMLLETLLINAVRETLEAQDLPEVPNDAWRITAQLTERYGMRLEPEDLIEVTKEIEIAMAGERAKLFDIHVLPLPGSGLSYICLNRLPSKWIG